jgi:hypothetical protein
VFRRFRRSGPAKQISPAEISLIKARRFLKNGRFAQAGMILSGLAREAEHLERRKVAAELHSRAAHCFVDGGAEQTGLSEAQAALRVFTNLRMEERRERFLMNITRKLELHRMTAAVGTLRVEFGRAESLNAESFLPLPGLRLPTNCPQCGGPMRSDEVEWVDRTSAECNYCGGVVQGKEN